MTQTAPAEVQAALSQLDGTPESAIALLADVPVDQLGQYGGMPAPKVLGLDLSLTCTGVAGNGWTDTIEPVKRGAAHRDRKNKTRDAQLRTAYNHERLSAIHRTLRTLLPADLVVMEGLAFDAHDTDRQQAGLSWNVRHFLWSHDVPYAVVPPSTLKQFVTGTGAADKALMSELIADWFPWFDGGHDEADAAGLMAMGYAHLGLPLGPMLDHQRTALDAVTWPEMPAADPNGCTDPGHPRTPAGWCQVCHWDGTEPHPRLPGVVRCANCKTHAEPAPLVVPYQGGRHTDIPTIDLPAQEASL